MGVVKWKTQVNKLPKVTKSVEGIEGKKVQIGVFNGEHAWLAGIHEYGCTITVTDKMRAFLHGQGLHLSPETKTITIPERSFIRSGHDENAERIIMQTERALGQVVAGNMSVDDMLDLYGEQMATAIKTYARNLNSPANHPFTIEQKGSSNPLVDSGDMIEHVEWKVEG